MNRHTDLFTVMNHADFAAFGLPVVAYVKRVDLGGITAWSVHGADGKTLGIEPSEDLATLAARQKNLMPVMLQ